MLATLVIGLREGLEAALVVGVIAAVLRRSGRGLGPMWIGVGLAALTSLAISGGLLAVESALPQAAQEGMEAVIGLLAVVFVTAMVLWMSKHARSVKRDLEAATARALRRGTGWALAAMAFLAVLKEGFETSVFLIATFRAAVDPVSAALGAVLGLGLAVVLGIGIATGGVRLDMRRFSRITSPFLVLLAAGLLLTAVRKAHGAGWIDAGQQRTVDLTWLAPRGSVQGALVTGVLGLPPDPRLIEVLAWAAYVVPVALVVLLPVRLRPRGRAAVGARWSVVALLCAAAIVLGASQRPMPVPVAAARPLVGGGTAAVDAGGLLVRRGGTTERVRLTGDGSPSTQDGAPVRTWTVTATTHPALARTITLDRIAALTGGRRPVGLGATSHAGPFDARWTVAARTTAVVSGGLLLDASRETTVLLTLSGGGLTASRTLTVPDRGTTTTSWRVTDGAAARARQAVAAAALLDPEHRLWGVVVPVLLLLAAAALLLPPPLRRRRRGAAGPTPIERTVPHAAS